MNTKISVCQCCVLMVTTCKFFANLNSFVVPHPVSWMDRLITTVSITMMRVTNFIKYSTIISFGTDATRSSKSGTLCSTTCRTTILAIALGCRLTRLFLNVKTILNLVCIIHRSVHKQHYKITVVLRPTHNFKRVT